MLGRHFASHRGEYMLKFLWAHAGRMAFSILCSMIGALVVSQLGLLQPRPTEKLEKIVFNQSDLTHAEEIARRVEAGHIAIRELLAAQEAEARRLAAAPIEREPIADQEQPRSRHAAQPDRKKPSAPRRELASSTPPAAPLVITPVTAADRPAVASRPDGLDGVFDKLTAGVSKIRDFVVNAVRIEKPANLPFGSTSAASDSAPLIDNLRGGLKLPAFEM